ncbi:MAG: hypothetical protein A3I66_21815 [Burkholderiales bacterium RIFCSPLOWO2_02_FULL_57_36]|nr:MAG: hypothetical protein A3I66_21815 [Burkholderiales bacterium RIFCSPLOWO2_02_FULL_57_36]
MPPLKSSSTRNPDGAWFEADSFDRKLPLAVIQKIESQVSDCGDFPPPGLPDMTNEKFTEHAVMVEQDFNTLEPEPESGGFQNA